MRRILSLILIFLANSSLAYTCNLWEKNCRLRGSDLVYVPVTPLTGTHYVCRLSVNNDCTMHAYIIGGKDFILTEPANVTIIKNLPTLISLKGHFISPKNFRDQGLIYIKNRSTCVGDVYCQPR